jgi:hypothetical protein
MGVDCFHDFPGDSGSEAEDESGGTDEDDDSIEGEEVPEDASPVITGEVTVTEEPERSPVLPTEGAGVVASDARALGKPDLMEGAVGLRSGRDAGNAGPVRAVREKDVDAPGERTNFGTVAVLRDEESLGQLGTGTVADVETGGLVPSVGVLRTLSERGPSEAAGKSTKLVVELTNRSLEPVGGYSGMVESEGRRHGSPKRRDERAGELQVCTPAYR